MNTTTSNETNGQANESVATTITTCGGITATLVSERDRMNFLPFYFGTRLMLRGEALVYQHMRRMCEGYNGGYWLFYTLSNGGFYMALKGSPDQAQRATLVHSDNFFEGDVSVDAAGVIVTLFAVNQLSWELAAANDPAADSLADAYNLLRDYAAGHLESHQIMRAID